MKLQAVPLTPEHFAPFGQVLMAENGVPERKPWAARVDNFRTDARANVTYMSLEPEHYPVTIADLERHRFSHQLFVPLLHTIHLVVVCSSLEDGNPDLKSVMAFHAAQGQCINYNADIWHAPRMVLEQSGYFVMIRWDDGTPADTELITLTEPIIVASPEN
jgi:ureidoglycolate lyase